MLTLVVYDISSNKSRKKVSGRLLDLGLIRAQYSVFLGQLDKNRADELTVFAEDHLEKTDRLYVIPIQRGDLAAARVVGKGFDEELVAGELLTKVI